jgi:hypothetical protein
MSDLIGGRRPFRLEPATKVADFVVSNREVDIIQGPLGSGKTRALCARVMRHAQEQRVSRVTGMRMSRWAIVRNTYPDLNRTTIRTWLEMFPEQVYGRLTRGQRLYHHIRFAFGEAPVDLEIDFLALDKPDDYNKLRSAEYTGIAWNEVPFIPKELFDEGSSRLRYPGAEHGGSEWHGMIADANAPDEDHWLAMMTGQVDFPANMTEDEKRALAWPDHWGFHNQPPAVLEQYDKAGQVVGYEVNPMAENLANLPPAYYAKMIPGKTKAWIDSRLRNVCVLVVDGSPVFPMFKRELHIAGEALRAVPNAPLTVGLDFGLQPAAIFMQEVDNRVYVQYELIGYNEGSATFAPKVKRFIAQHYPDHALSQVNFWGDPKGQDRPQSDMRTSYDIFAANGMKVRPPPGLKQNMISTRIEAVTTVLSTLDGVGRPRAVFSPLCRTLNVAMLGRYHLVREEEGELKPKKDRYSNPADALQYAVLGIGEGRAMIGLGRALASAPARVFKRNRDMRRVTG